MSNSNGAIFGEGNFSIAICDRCGKKFAYKRLRADGAKPALRVCGSRMCYDGNHPIKTFVPQPVRVALRYPRPDVLLEQEWILINKDATALQGENTPQDVTMTLSPEEGYGIKLDNDVDPVLLDSFNSHVPRNRGGTGSGG